MVKNVTFVWFDREIILIIYLTEKVGVGGKRIGGRRAATSSVEITQGDQTGEIAGGGEI